MAMCTLENHIEHMRKRFFVAKGVRRFLDISKEIGLESFHVQRFAHGLRLSWQNLVKIETWIIEQEKKGESK